MARVNNKMINLTGMVGGLVFYKSIYGDLVRTKPEFSEKKRKSSALQKLQQDKMLVVMDFLRPLKHLLQEHVFPPGSHLPAFHWAKSYYLNEVVYFENESYHIHFSKGY